MIAIERRLYVRVNRQALRQWMAYRGLTIRQLAASTRPRISSSTVGHLASGHRTTCSPETARAVERALDVPSGSIFQPTACNVPPHATRAAS